MLFVHQPFLEKTLCGVSFAFFCLPFPFLMFACLFETNFPNIPFFSPSCFHFWQFLFSSVVLVFFSWCMFQPFCFYVGFVFGICFVFDLCFCFFVLLLVSLSVYEKSCFPCNSGVFWVMLLKRVVCFFSYFMFLFLCAFLCCLFPFLELICIILFLCCCFVTRLSGLLVCILRSFFLFFFCCFVLNLFFVFPFLSKKGPPKKPDTAKTQKCKNAEKRTKNQLAQLCSQIVFFNFLGWD